MRDTAFKEKTIYNDRIIYAVLMISLVTITYFFIKSLFAPVLTYTSTLVFLGATLTIGGVLFWLKKLELSVNINEKRIKYKMLPLHRKSRKISWAEIDSWKVIKTPGFAQWHGGNIHFGRVYWYSLTGKNGLAIKTKDGNYYFIGCKALDELDEVLHKLMDMKS